MEMLLLTVAGGISTFLLVRIYLGHREIRGRVLPLWILTLLHTISLPVNFCMPPDVGGWCGIAGIILDRFYSLGIPVFLLFICIYAVALGDSNRMTRQIGLAAAIFAGNLILQFLLILIIFSFILD